MKYIKMLGLAAVAAAALMAFVGASTASATQLTGAGGTVLGVGTVIHADVEGKVTLHPPIGSIECSKGTVGGKVTNAGSASTTVSGAIEALTFEECNAAVTVLKKGTLEIHTAWTTVTHEPAGQPKVHTYHTETVPSGNGTLTSSGAEVTIVFSGFHCVFSTSNTSLGTVTGSANTGATATLDISASIPRTGGSSGIFCGSTAAWTGSYKVSNPDVLNIH